MDTYYLVVTYILTGLVGLCVGSFLNVVIYRVPLGMSLASPGSHCPKCGYALQAADNIPVLSWIMLGGKCRKCKSAISPRYMLVELANCLLWLLSVFLFGETDPVYACICALSASVLICVFYIDLEHMLIFNRFTLLIAAFGLVTVFVDRYTQWYDHIIGAGAGAIVFLMLYFGTQMVLKKEGLGFGDVKLAAAAGLLLGWQKLIFAILIASVSGSIVLLVLRKIRSDVPDKEYPFGPFLAVGILIALLFGTPVLQWYVGLILP